MVTAQPVACASARGAAMMVATSVWLSTALLFISILLSSYFGCSLAALGGRPNHEALLLHRFLDHFDPVLDRRAAGAIEVGLAAAVGGDDHLRLAALQCVALVVAQLGGSVRLGDRNDSGRAPAP